MGDVGVKLKPEGVPVDQEAVYPPVAEPSKKNVTSSIASPSQTYWVWVVADDVKVIVWSGINSNTNVSDAWLHRFPGVEITRL